MATNLNNVLMGFYFYPRGGSAHAGRAIACELERNGIDVTVLSGSRDQDCEDALAERFFAPAEVRSVDFSSALASPEPTRFSAASGSAPMHGSYEDRPGAPDTVFAKLDDAAYESHVAAWERELAAAGAAETDLLYLHHLTPLNEAARRSFPQASLVGHIHGSELLMLEQILEGAPADWTYADEWAERLSEWAARCDRLIVNSPEGLRRAGALLDLDPGRFELVPNGFDPSFHRMDLDRRAHWRRHLVTEPRGWRPDGQGDGVSRVGYSESDLEALSGPTLLYSGRFTEVKRLPLLIEAYATARERFNTRSALVLLGGYPGEWEGEHPADVIERLGARDVFLAGWHGRDVLPQFLNAADVLVHASVREQFGLVLIEGMACGVPPIAVDRGGPAIIVDAGESGWLVPPDDVEALADAMVGAVNDPEQRRKRGRRSREVAVERYTWASIGERLVSLLEEVAEAGEGRYRDTGAFALRP